MIKRILLMFVIAFLWYQSYWVNYAATSVWWWQLTLGWQGSLWNPTKFTDFFYTWPGGSKWGHWAGYSPKPYRNIIDVSRDNKNLSPSRAVKRLFLDINLQTWGGRCDISSPASNEDWAGWYKLFAKSTTIKSGIWNKEYIIFCFAWKNRVKIYHRVKNSTDGYKEWRGTARLHGIINIPPHPPTPVIDNPPVPQKDSWDAELSLPFWNKSVCTSKRDYNNKKYPDYIRGDCFQKNGKYYYYICDKWSNACGGNGTTQDDGVSTDVYNWNPYSNSFNAKLLAKLKKVTVKFETLDVAKLKQVLLKLDKLWIKYKSSKVVSNIIWYLKFETNRIIESKTKNNDVDDFFCELSWTCSTTTNCSDEYLPVCGKSKYPVWDESSEYIYKTFSNKCNLNKNKNFTFNEQGKCKKQNVSCKLNRWFFLHNNGMYYTKWNGDYCKMRDFKLGRDNLAKKKGKIMVYATIPQWMNDKGICWYGLAKWNYKMDEFLWYTTGHWTWGRLYSNGVWAYCVGWGAAPSGASTISKIPTTMVWWKICWEEPKIANNCEGWKRYELIPWINTPWTGVTSTIGWKKIDWGYSTDLSKKCTKPNVKTWKCSCSKWFDPESTVWFMWSYNYICTKIVPKTNGICGLVNNQTISKQPTYNLCNSWNPWIVYKSWGFGVDGEWYFANEGKVMIWSWKCRGISWWVDQSCNAKANWIAKRWQCAYPNTKDGITPSLGSLCKSGTPIGLRWVDYKTRRSTSANKWIWKCKGSNFWYTPLCNSLTGYTWNWSGWNK